MKVELLRPSRIKHEAGEIVEVSPDNAIFLISTNSARAVAETKEETPKKTTKGKK